MSDSSETTPSAPLTDDVDRRGFLSCMAWAGSVLLWTMRGSAPTSGLLGARPAAKDDGFLVQFSDTRRVLYEIPPISRFPRSPHAATRPEDTEMLSEDAATSEPVATVRVRLYVVESLESEAIFSARIVAQEIAVRVLPRGLPTAGSDRVDI